MPFLPSDLPDPVPGDPISAGDMDALSKSTEFLMNYVADNAKESPGSQYKRDQNPIIQRLGTITKLVVSLGQPLKDYSDARYYVAVSSPRTNLKPDGTAAGQTPDVLATNPNPEITSSIVTEIVTATNLAELPPDASNNPANPYPNGVGSHTIPVGTRVWLWGVPVEWNPLILRWVFYSGSQQVWIKINGISDQNDDSDLGSGFYSASLITGTPQTIDPLTNEVIPTSPSESIPDPEGILAENCLEANSQPCGVGTAPTHWVPIGSIVPAYLIGTSNEETEGGDAENRPTYRFCYPNPVFTIKIIGTLYPSHPGGRYTCVVVNGRVAGQNASTAALNWDTSVASNTNVDAGENAILDNSAYFENSAENGIANSHWIPLGSYVEARWVGYDNSTPPKQIFRAYVSNPSPPAVVKITSNISGASGKYNGTIYQIPTTDTGAGDLTLPDGMTAGVSCLIINTEEPYNTLNTAAGTHRLFINSYAVGTYGGMSQETPPRPTIIVCGGFYRIDSPTNLPVGTYGAPDGTSWCKQSGATANGTPVQTAQMMTVFNFDAGSGNIWYHYRTLLFDAGGKIYSISAETEVTIATSTCAGSTGTVTSVSVSTSATSGLNSLVLNPTTAPNITLSVVPQVLSASLQFGQTMMGGF